jgi:5-methyltetrahydropteroyltriglutamate--homocysteine methyltransferase
MACAVCRADHIGSLLRPRAIKDAYKAHAQGTLDDAGFEAVQDKAIREVVRMQEAAGLDAVTDGEFRRQSWFAAFVEAVDGLTHKETYFNFTDDAHSDVPTKVPHVEAPIRRTHGITTHEFDFLKGVAKKTPKVTMPSPSVIHFFRGQDGIDKGVYPDMERFWADLAAVYQAEIADLARRGCTYVQIDEVPMALLCDAKVRERIAAWGWDPAKLLDTYIRATNQALAGRPEGVTVGMHMCRGNFRGRWIGTGGYDWVAERVFPEVDVDLFLLEYDSERAGDFAPLRFVPAEKAVVLGLISSKTPKLEPMDGLLKRIGAASRYVPMERLAVSPQCGFGTTVGGAPMTEDDEKRKLALVGEVARRAWG